jgi:hypothetical protein
MDLAAIKSFVLGVGALAALLIAGAAFDEQTLSSAASAAGWAMQNIEVPIVNLTRALREWNWAGGSCVHASNVMALRWLNELAVAKWWRETYSGGESYEGLTGKLRKAGIAYRSTHTGDIRVLEQAIAERRAAVIFYYPNHSILLVHLDPQRAIVLDNNRIDQFIEIPRATFDRKWREYGGVGIVPMIGAPRPPLPFLNRW